MNDEEQEPIGVAQREENNVLLRTLNATARLALKTVATLLAAGVVAAMADHFRLSGLVEKVSALDGKIDALTLIIRQDQGKFYDHESRIANLERKSK